MKRLLRCAAALLIAAVAVPAAQARDKRVTATSQFADITVSLDDTIKSIRELAADCTREANRWAAQRRKEVAQAIREEPQQRGAHWTLQRDYETRSVVGRYVSVLRSDYLNTGGAHPNTQIDTILWDGASNKRVSIRPFFNETADGGPTMTAMVALLRAAINTEKEQRGKEAGVTIDAFAGLEPKLLALGPVTLAPSTESNKSAGLTFHYEPYAVGAYAEGIYTVFLPWEDLKPYLSADGLQVFAGQRPDDDVKKFSTN